MQKPLGIIGVGNMGEALVDGITQSGLLRPREIHFFEPRSEREEFLRKKFGINSTKSNQALVSQASTLILAVKPQMVSEVLRQIALSITPHHLLISICAGISIAYIQSFLPNPIRIIRAMPNTPVLVRKGATALAPSPKATSEDLAVAEAIFQAVGTTVVVKESQMDAVTGLSGSGPAYIFTVIEALTAGGVKEGLPQDVALALITQTALGAAHLILATANHPETLRNQVCTPAGTTMAGLYAMEQGGLRLALMNAVIAATQRSKEIGEGLQKTSGPYPMPPEIKSREYPSATTEVRSRQGRNKKNSGNLKRSRKPR
jgi:pyrroline-5-carboxylate reductase